MAAGRRAPSVMLWQRLASQAAASRLPRRGAPSSPFVIPGCRLGADCRSSPGLLHLGFGACRSFSSSSRAEDPYKILGISRNATPEEIKKAYKKEAMKWHPDRQPPEKRDEAQKRFTEVANAYETLSEPQKRSAHDVGGGTNGFPGGFHHPGGNTQASAEDLFRQVFGQGGFHEIIRGMQGIPVFGAPGVIGVGSTVKVHTDKRRVLALCRKAGIDTENDGLRIKSLGKEGRVIKVDRDDNTAKVTVKGVGDVWLPAEAVDAAGGMGLDRLMFTSPFVNTPFGAGGAYAQQKTVQQRLVLKPDGQEVLQIIVQTRGPDGQIRKEVSEVPVQR